jgi:hypothetical protein
MGIYAHSNGPRTIFSIHVDVTPIIQGNVVATPVVGFRVTMVVTHVVGSPMTEIDEGEEPIFQESIVTHEEEQ